MKQKLALFLITSTFFSVLIALGGGASAPFSGFSSVIKASILYGVLCGILFTFIVLFYQWYYLRNMGLNKNGISVVNSIEFEAEGDKEEIFTICLESINCLKKCQIGQLNKGKGIFSVNIGINWRTWGDIIHFDIKGINENKCIVEVTSRPKMETTLIDFGKNLENIIKITNYLKSKTKIKVVQNGSNIIL
ncbi:hypothetical protein [Bacillus sp. FJAT-28004]|uniref:hypothetical protein n=1 Tax=Bacillus sp. FJAT-28004 TaxID=1679165 RepID=UPI0006B53AF0|nr:hypothetical protein [Bacillus sp. FJAT-28004]